MRKIGKNIKAFLIFLLVAVISCTALCCTQSGKQGSAKHTDDDPILPAMDREKYLFGGGELASEVGPSGDWRDEGTTMNWTTSTAGALGVKSERVWIQFPSVIKRAVKSNELSLIRGECDRYHEYIAKLKANGVERVMLMCARYLYPYGFTSDQNTNVPDPNVDPEIYKEWHEMLYECFRMLAEEFPEIKYFEVGNEYDLSDFMNKSGFRTDKTQIFTASEAGWITADICYTANKAIKSVNRYNVCIMPGMSQYATVAYFESFYDAIESKKLPTMEDFYVTDSDKYFDIIAWHNYPIKSRYGTNMDKMLEDFLTTCNERYEVAQKHGDGDKRVWITEIGISDDNITAILPQLDANAALEKLSEYSVKMMQIVKNDMPYVETAFWFRYSDMYSGAIGTAEDHFGLFYSVDDPVHHGKPKPVAIGLYKWLHGDNADTSKLYWYCSQYGIEE